MDKNREAFEAWWKNPEQAELRKSCAQGWGCYVWTAARQAIEVGIPQLAVDKDARLSVETSLEGAFNLGVIRCRQALTSLGIRVKGNEE